MDELAIEFSQGSDSVTEPAVIAGLDDLRARVGSVLGITAPRQITQSDVDAFADVTGDQQWIHVDPERAATGPFGGTIVHGFFTLALLPACAAEVFRVDSVTARVNYGLAKVRFPRPFPVGSYVVDSIRIVDAVDVPGGLRVTFQHTMSIDADAKPVCIAETITQFVA